MRIIKVPSTDSRYEIFQKLIEAVNKKQFDNCLKYLEKLDLDIPSDISSGDFSVEHDRYGAASVLHKMKLIDSHFVVKLENGIIKLLINCDDRWQDFHNYGDNIFYVSYEESDISEVYEELKTSDIINEMVVCGSYDYFTTTEREQIAFIWIPTYMLTDNDKIKDIHVKPFLNPLYLKNAVQYFEKYEDDLSNEKLMNEVMKRFSIDEKMYQHLKQAYISSII